MCAKASASRQAGFSLAETLIAAAIAAGLVAATTQSISASVRLASAVDREQRLVSEAQTIAARLRVGIDDAGALEGFDGWTIARNTVPPLRDNDPPVYDQIRILSDRSPDRPFEFWAPTVRGSSP